MADVPRQRLAGVVMITDGQVHDVPAGDANALAEAVGGPLHVLLSGRPDEGDRRLVVSQASSFGLVGKELPLTIRVEDLPETSAKKQAGATGQARLTWRKDGGSPHQIVVPVVDRDVPLAVPIDHGGPNVIELEVEPGPQELTLVNNRAVVVVNGVRDRATCVVGVGRTACRRAGLAQHSGNPTHRSTSSISRSCGPPKSRTARRSANCR